MKKDDDDNNKTMKKTLLLISGIYCLAITVAIFAQTNTNGVNTLPPDLLEWLVQARTNGNIYVPPNIEEILSRPQVPYKNQFTTIPQMAGTADIIGVGRVTNKWENGKGVVLDVDNYWYGNPGSNTLSFASHATQLIATNTPLVFFLSTYDVFPDMNPDGVYYLVFDMDELRARSQPSEPVFFDHERGWFYASDTNLVTFASNLVVAARSSNTNAFYEIMRDGNRLNPKGSRIHDDSEDAFSHSCYYMTTNIMKQVWNDPLLPEASASWIMMNYRQQTGVSIR